MISALSGGRFIEFNRLYVSGKAARWVHIPFPFAGQPREVLASYVKGNDPMTGRPVMQSIVDGLTKPPTADELQSGLPPMPEVPRLLGPDTEENLQELFKKNDWTDYAPIVLPTEERVARMLTATNRKPTDVVQAGNWALGLKRPITVEKVAIAAVMAGARLEYFPTILATASSSPFALSTVSFSNAIFINGPIRNEINMNYKINAMGPFNEANAVIGRAFLLLAKTAGGIHAYPTPTVSSTTSPESMGNNLQYNSVVTAENEEALPEGWKPLHVQLGFKKEDSVVSVSMSGTSYIHSQREMTGYPPHKWMLSVMQGLSGGATTIYMDPTVAKMLHDSYGFKSKEMLSKWICDNFEMPVEEYWSSVNYASLGQFASAGMEPYATWLRLWKTAPRTKIKPCINPKDINIVVVGGGTQTTFFVTDFRPGKCVKIDGWKAGAPIPPESPAGGPSSR